MQEKIKDNTISRQAVIDRINKQREHLQPDIYPQDKIGDAAYRICAEFIERLPSAQPEPHWIPVSERLPEYGVAVLTYDGHCFCVEKRIPKIRYDEGEPITGDWWVSEYDSDYYPNIRDGACIAWMPLPEPYREERRTDARQT